MFTRNDALRLVSVALVGAETTPTDGDNRPVAVAFMMPNDMFPAVSIAQTGVKIASVGVANNKCATVLAYGQNTAELHDYDASDVLSAQAAFPRFTKWDGGIKVYDQDGVLLGALAVSGRSARGDRILAVIAAHTAGYRTDFGDDGLTDAERAKSQGFPGDL